MKPATSQLITLLGTRQFGWCKLFQFDLANGASLYYCSGDVDIKIGSQVYSCGNPGGPFFETEGNLACPQWNVGLQVETLQFDFAPGSGLISGQPITQAIQQGIFDGAQLTMSSCYWPQQAYINPLVPTGAIIEFVGRCGDMIPSRTRVTVNANSHTELLDQNMPRNVYQAGCLNTLYDSACTLNQASFAVNGSIVGSGSSQSIVFASMSQATGYFDLGKIKFTSGALNGLTTSVKSYTKGTPGPIAFNIPMPTAPANGDTFTIYPGCDKTSTTCTNKFSNFVNFRGFPTIPDSATGV